jgi:hypothetical protein
MKKLLILSASLSVLAMACGGSAATTSTVPTVEPTTTTAAPGPSDSERLVLRVGYRGGFVPIDFFVNQSPAWELYADGALYTEGILPAIFPGPVMRPLQIIEIGDDILGVMDLVEDSGLPAIDQEFDNDGANQVADAGETVFQYRDEQGVDHVLGVYALGFEQPPQGRDAILIQLTDFLSQLVGEGDATEFMGDRIQVYIHESDPSQDTTSETVDWTLPVDPEAFEVSDQQDWSCAVLDGDEAAAAVDVLQDSTETTNFDFDGTTYTAKARYLMPAEAGCTPVFDF